MNPRPIIVKEGVSSPRATEMFHPLSTVYESSLALRLRKYFALATNSCNNSTSQQTLFWIKQLIRWQITTVGNNQSLSNPPRETNDVTKWVFLVCNLVTRPASMLGVSKIELFSRRI